MKNTLHIIFVVLALVPMPMLAADTSEIINTHIRAIQNSMREDLSNNRIEQARNNLEQAAGNFHSVEIELGLIQTLMQAGEYRHALSAAAHTQAEHPDTTDSTLFYAWLLAIGGQYNPANQLLESAIRRNPGDKPLQLMQTQIKTRNLAPEQLKTTENIQLMPFTISSTPIPSTLSYLQSGILANDGQHVITTLFDIPDLKMLRVRNGLGVMVRAHFEGLTKDNTFAILTLEKPIKHTQGTSGISTAIKPGMPIYVIGYSQAHHSQAGWPHAKIDILGMPDATTGMGYAIHVQTPATGAGVYNQNGELVGLVKNNVMIPITKALESIHNKQRETTNSGTVSAGGSNKTIDEIYESVLGTTIQILSE